MAECASDGTGDGYLVPKTEQWVNMGNAGGVENYAFRRCWAK